MRQEPFGTKPDMQDVKQLAEVLHLSKAGVNKLLNCADFSTLRVSGRKLVMKND